MTWKDEKSLRKLLRNDLFVIVQPDPLGYVISTFCSQALKYGQHLPFFVLLQPSALLTVPRSDLPNLPVAIKVVKMSRLIPAGVAKKWAISFSEHLWNNFREKTLGWMVWRKLAAFEKFSRSHETLFYSRGHGHRLGSVKPEPPWLGWRVEGL